MKVLVVGAGAVGTWFAGELRSAGCEIVFAPRELAAVVPLDVELAVVAVKAYDTPGAVATLQRALAEPRSAAILCLQNGIGNEEQLAAAFGADAVIAGALTVPVEREAGGSVRAANRGGLGIAPFGKQAHNWLIALLNRTGMPLVVAGDAAALKWSKLSLNIIANATAAILDVEPVQIMNDRRLFALERAALLELRALLRTLRIRPVDLPRYPVRALLGAAALPEPLARAILAPRIARARGGKTPSLLLDLRQGRGHSEVGVLNGAIAAAAAQAGLAAPVNAGLTRILQEITTDAGRRERYRTHPAALLAEFS